MLDVQGGRGVKNLTFCRTSFVNGPFLQLILTKNTVTKTLPKKLYLKCTCSHFGFNIVVKFSTF